MLAAGIPIIMFLVGVGIYHQRFIGLEEDVQNLKVRDDKLTEWKEDVNKKLERIITILEERDRTDTKKASYGEKTMGSSVPAQFGPRLPRVLGTSTVPISGSSDQGFRGEADRGDGQARPDYSSLGDTIPREYPKQQDGWRGLYRTSPEELGRGVRVFAR